MDVSSTATCGTSSSRGLGDVMGEGEDEEFYHTTDCFGGAVQHVTYLLLVVGSRPSAA
jgi:hypothetical protein